MRRAIGFILLVFLLCVFVAGCGKDDFNISDQSHKTLPKLHVDRNYIRDEYGRYVFFHGVNVSGSTKYPASTDPISYVGKPFPLDQVDFDFKKLKEAGFNVLRLLIIWEGIEPYTSGEYDLDYLDYIQSIVEKANDYGIYVFLDMHQDLFSRHLCKKYHDADLPFGLGGLAAWVESGEQNTGPLNNIVQGDMAPRWVVQLALYEKNVYSPEWCLPSDQVSDPANYCDVWPVDPWGANYYISVDVNRCFATFFAGDKIYPNWKVVGKSVKDYLQDSFMNSWLQVVGRVKDYPNVIGYDVINEPSGTYYLLTIIGMLGELLGGNKAKSLTQDDVEQVVDLVLSELVARGIPSETAANLKTILLAPGRLPTTAEEFASMGFPIMLPSDDPHWADIDAVLDLNVSFNRKYLQPLHEKVGQAIQAIDPDAIIFIEESLGLGDTGLIYAMEPMLRPAGLNQVIYAPHYYADIYPYLGEDPPPRNFTRDEMRYRDYTDAIKAVIGTAAYSLSNVPVLLGEFGTYFNFNGIDQSMAQNYIVSSEILDNYYEALEKLMVSHTQWCYSSENTAASGEGWNEEDFSILGPDKQYRSKVAFMRPFVRFASGRPLQMYFYSDLHYYEPMPGRPTPYREYFLETDAKESDAPTEIFLPELQYPNGFYVYVSDGRCAYDANEHILYWYLDNDEPQVHHTIRIRPPYDNYGDSTWNYFFDGKVFLENGRR